MYLLLLALVYLAFVSLGLPDSLLGAAWPSIRTQLGVPLSYAGVVSMCIAGGTVLSGLSADWMTKKLGVGLVTAVSVLLTALAMLGFSASNTLLSLCLWSVPYGLGAGAIDAALNNHVALHYSSRHMNWLHCFWGVGVTTGPVIMGYALTHDIGWHGGYRIVAVLQFALTIALFAALPLWKKAGILPDAAATAPLSPVTMLLRTLRLKGIGHALAALFCYCALEATTGLWASSYLVLRRDVPPETAAKYASLFYLGITIGRFLSGFISGKVGDTRMIRTGALVALAGLGAVWLPASPDFLYLNGLVVIGLGCAPIFPAALHQAPAYFGKENSQMVIAVQMGCAYAGATFMPPLFGLVATHAGIGFYPVFLLLFAVLLLMQTEILRKCCSTPSGSTA